MESVILTRLDIHPDRVDEAMALLAEMSTDVAANEPGTTYYRFYRDEHRTNTYWAIEVFVDAEAKATHLARHQHRVPQFESVLERSIMNELTTATLP